MRYTFNLPANKQETKVGGNIYLVYNDPSTNIQDAYSPLSEGTFRLGVSEFYTRQIAELLSKHIRHQNADRIASIMYGGNLATREKALPPNQVFKKLYKDPTGYYDTTVKDLLEKIVPFNGHTKTANLIVEALAEIVSAQVMESGFNPDDEAHIVELVPNYTYQVVDQLIRSSTWPTTQDIAFRIRSTTEKSSPYANRVKVGLDKAAQSTVVSLQTQVASASVKKQKIMERYKAIRDKADASGSAVDQERANREELRARNEINKLQASLDKEIIQASSVFRDLQAQVISRQPMIELAMEEQQIMETREQTEARARQSSINPLRHLAEAMTKWSGGLIGSKYSDQIRNVRMRALATRLSPKALLSNMKLEFVDSMRENKGIVRSTLRALGSVVTLRPFSNTIQQLAGEQRAAHEELAMVASESSKPIRLGPAGRVPDPSSTPPTTPIRTPPPPPTGSAGANIDDIMDAVRDQMRTVIDETSTFVGEFVDQASNRLRTSLSNIQAQLNDRLRQMQSSATLQVDDPDAPPLNDTSFNPLDEPIRELADSEIEPAAAELQVNLSRYGGARPQDWAKIIALLRAVARRERETGQTQDNKLGLLPTIMRLIGPLGVAAVVGAGLANVSRNHGPARANLIIGAAGSPSAVGSGAAAVAMAAQEQDESEQRLRARLRMQRTIEQQNRARQGRQTITDRIADLMTFGQGRRIQQEQYERDEQTWSGRDQQPSASPATSQPKRFNRSSKFANLGLDLGDHSSVGG